MTKNNIISVISNRHLTSSTYVLRMDRNGFDFEAGQYISLGLPNQLDKREYSIYSGMNDDFLEVMIKEVDEGVVSRQLKYLQPGKKAEMDGPFGFFTLDKESRQNKPLVFIASGTGIAPFHSFIQSYPELDYQLIHGVRYGDEAYEHEVYDQERYMLCTSRDNRGHFHGRLTDYLKSVPAKPQAEYYLCGNSNMIHDAYDILKEKGVGAGNMHAEVYF